MEQKAKFYSKKNNGYIVCELCPHGCYISEEKVGECGARKVSKGELKALNYGAISSLAMDPIEKKPLYHYKPGSQILSVGSYGCNFKCGFCQNYHISMEKPTTKFVEPKDLIDLGIKTKSEGNIGIAFTYNEPLIGYEFLYDVCKDAKGTNLSMVLVSNGFINHQPLNELLPLINAANIDLKSFTKKYYNEVCFGNLDNVIENIYTISTKCHLEITTLLVNGYNDSDEEIRNLSKWIAEIDKDIPLHLSRYYPNYKFDAEATPINRILSCWHTAKEYLNYVYVGNIADIDNNTYCPNCHEIVIRRQGSKVKNLTNNGICSKCGFKIKIVL